MLVWHRDEFAAGERVANAQSTSASQIFFCRSMT
jgi:hypothetical protein